MTTAMRPSIIVRLATLADEEPLGRLLQRAAYLYQGTYGSTARTLLHRLLLFIAWEGEGPRACLGVNLLHPSTAKIEEVAVRGPHQVGRCLTELLPVAEVKLREEAAQTLVYMGQDAWLIAALEDQGFCTANCILAFRKRGWDVPHPGNERVRIRPAAPDDIPVLARVDEVAFQEPLWQNSGAAFQEWLNRAAHFVVAEQKEQVVGYQFSLVREGEGYLARVVVHPRVQGQRIGVRLVADAIHFFQQRGVRDIVLNTQQDNHKAQRLYRWFGFQPSGQEALVLQKRLRE